MNEWTYLIGNLGFPIVMCLYFALRFEKVLGNNTLALKELSTKIQLGGCNGRTRKYYKK